MAGLGATRAADIGLGQSAAARTRGFFGSVLRLARAKPLGAVSAIILIVLVFVALFAPLLRPIARSRTTTASRCSLRAPNICLAPTSSAAMCLSRIIWGARVSLEVGLGATIAGGVIAVVIGIISAYFGGVVDYVIQRVVDTVQAIPPLDPADWLLVILGPWLTNVIIALSLRTAFVTSRIMRSAALTIMGQPYVDAGRVIGASTPASCRLTSCRTSWPR